MINLEQRIPKKRLVNHLSIPDFVLVFAVLFSGVVVFLREYHPANNPFFPVTNFA